MRDAPVSRVRLDGLSRKTIQSKRRAAACRTDSRAGICPRLTGADAGARSARVQRRVDLAEQPLHAGQMLLVVAAQVVDEPAHGQ